MPAKYHLCFFFPLDKNYKAWIINQGIFKMGICGLSPFCSTGLITGERNMYSRAWLFQSILDGFLGKRLLLLLSTDSKGTWGHLAQIVTSTLEKCSVRTICVTVPPLTILWTSFSFPLPCATRTIQHRGYFLPSALGWRVKSSTGQGKQAKSITGQKEH